MVVLAKGELEQIALPAAHPPPADVASVDLSNPDRAAAARALVAACEEHGFFRVTGHGVAPELARAAEAASARFFALPQADKEAEAARLGYGSKGIGGNGDLGWIEYLLLGLTPAGASSSTLPCSAAVAAASSTLPPPSPLRFSRPAYGGGRAGDVDLAHVCRYALEVGCMVSVDAPPIDTPPLWDLLEEYAAAVRRMACAVLELLAEGLGVVPPDALARLVTRADSDCMLRVNHYPPRPAVHAQEEPGLLTGFGEHTDPQIISVLRSNATSGLEVALRDGAWAAVPPDSDAFFVNVGDTLQVLTNGRFRSVRHRVVVNGERSRVSMVFFGGPPPGERLAPLPQLLQNGGRSRYKEFTWNEFKSSGCRTRLAEDRLSRFEN